MEKGLERNCTESPLYALQVAPGFSSYADTGHRVSLGPSVSVGRAHRLSWPWRLPPSCGAATAARILGRPGCPFATLLGGKPVRTPVSFRHVGRYKKTLKLNWCYFHPSAP